MALHLWSIQGVPDAFVGLGIVLPWASDNVLSSFRPLSLF